MNAYGQTPRHGNVSALRRLWMRRWHTVTRGAVAVAACAALTAVGLVGQPTIAAANASAAPKTAPQSDVTVVAFQQSWNTIAKECTETYGPEGVGYIQVSPPEESIQGTQWWTAYQPVSYRIDSKFGTEAEFKSMIQQCNAVGVSIAADAVINHTTGADVALVNDQQGVAGSAYNGSYGRYPAMGDGVYRYKENGNGHQYGLTTNDFHDCTDTIADYTNADQVRNCRLSTMWDLNTGSEHVQDIQADYLARLWQDGVRAYRIDSAKHIDPSDLAAIKAKLAKKIGVAAADIPWVQEVIYHEGEADALNPKNYLRNGKVIEFSYAYQLKQDFFSSVTKLKNISKGLTPSPSANVFVSNWDTERSDETLTPALGARYELANAFLLANDYGSPKLMSSYWYGSDTAAGPSGATDTTVPDVDMNTACKAATGNASDRWQDGQWLCQQRWTSVRGMIGFHNAVQGTSVANWQNDGDNNIGFARRSNGQDQGFFAMNNTLQAHHVSYSTNLPDGDYCNVYASRDCSVRVTVKGGKLDTTIGARSAVAIYAGATPSTWVNSSTGATDASDPGYQDTADGSKVADRSLTVYYRADKNWGNVNLYYSLGGSDATKTLAMRQVSGHDGWYSATIADAGLSGVSFHFGNGSGAYDWLNGKEGTSYQAEAGATVIAVQSHQSSLGMPFATKGENKTRFTLHVSAGINATHAEVWGTDKTGKTLAKKSYAFTGTDSFGNVLTHEFAGDYAAFSFRLTDDSGATVIGGDYSAAALDHVSGAVEAWVDSNDPSKAFTSSPAARTETTIPTANDQKNPKNLHVIIHYQRADGQYQQYNLDDDTWQGWDVWSWQYNSAGSSYAFTDHDDFGEIASFDLNSASGVRNVEFLLRKGGNAWLAKDPDNSSNREIPESLLSVADSENGTAEFWVVSGDPTLYAYRPTTHLVTFDGNGGEPTTRVSVADRASQVGTGIAVPSALTRTGYVFSKWTSDKAGKQAYDFGTPVTDDMTLYAQWDPAYTVNFDNDGYDYQSYTVQQGSTATKPAQDPTREGFLFDGWYADAGRTTPFDFTKPLTSDVTLYAGWKSTNHTVAFDSQGGSPVAPQTVVEGKATTAPAAPTRSGYTFGGWFTDPQGAQSYNFAAPVTGDLTLYALWVDNASLPHSVTFHANDGTQNTSWIRVPAGSTVQAPNPGPTRQDYRFTFWSLDAAGTQPYDFSTPVNTDLDLYAQWAGMHTVSFDTGTDAGIDPQQVSDGATVARPTDPTRDGYTFTGWSTDKAGKNVFDFNTPVTSDLTLVAQWAAKQQTVTYDAQGGSAVANQQVAYGSPVARPGEPTRDGYVFEGWSTQTDDPDGSHIYDFNAPVTGDVTLYALWAPQEASVAASKVEIVMHVYDDVTYREHVRNGRKAVKPVDPIRSGYTFTGWTTDKTGKKPYDFTAPVAAPLSLYAQWSKNPDSGSSSDNGGETGGNTDGGTTDGGATDGSGSDSGQTDGNGSGSTGTASGGATSGGTAPSASGVTAGGSVNLAPAGAGTQGGNQTTGPASAGGKLAKTGVGAVTVLAAALVFAGLGTMLRADKAKHRRPAGGRHTRH